MINFMEKKTQNISLIAQSSNSELKRIREFIESNALDFGFSEELSQKIALAVDEACSNLIKHAYKSDSTQRIWINLEFIDNQLVVKILDEGNPFNPLQVPEPDMKNYFKNFNRGGLGIQIMRLVMDKINYFPSGANSNKNTLELIKVLN